MIVNLYGMCAEAGHPLLIVLRLEQRFENEQQLLSVATKEFYMARQRGQLYDAMVVIEGSTKMTIYQRKQLIVQVQDQAPASEPDKPAASPSVPPSPTGSTAPG